MDEFTALIDVERQAVTFLKTEHRHGQIAHGGIEFLRRLLHRIADEYRRADLLALVLGANVLEHFFDLGRAGATKDPVIVRASSFASPVQCEALHSPLPRK